MEKSSGDDSAERCPEPTTFDSQHRRPSPAPVSAFKSLGWLDRFLAIWIFLAMVVGILLGNFVPDVDDVLEKGKFVGVSVPIAVGLLVMMFPILCKVRYESLLAIFADRGIWRQIGFSIILNWIVAPFFMLALSWAFLPDKSELRSGLILVGLGRCIAMVLVWTQLAGGDSEYCAILVAINSVMQMVLFAPMAVFFIRIIGHDTTGVSISYSVVAVSVAVFLGIPLGAAIVTRVVLRTLAGPEWYERVFLRFASPWSLIGLLYTILVRLGFGYALATTQSFTAASNNFELAIAVAVATFGPKSDQALAATVGPLVEVPVLLGLVYLVRWAAKRWSWKQ